MSFKEYLEDYDAREEESVRRYLKELAGSGVPDVPTYPPAVRFPGSRGPLADPKMSNIWGVIPLHGTTAVVLPPVSNVRDFDLTLENRGLSHWSLNEAVSFARETRRLVFVLGGPAVRYRNLDFLEPLFREFNPPRIPLLPLSMVIGERDCTTELAAFREISRLGLRPLVRDFMAATGILDEEQLEEHIDDMGSTYAILRRVGPTGLWQSLEGMLALDPVRAFHTLTILRWLVTEPILDVTGKTPVLGRIPVEFSRDVLGSFGTPIAGSVEPPEKTEIGRYVLSQVVRYPETRDGCMTMIQAYDAVGLQSIRDALYEGVKREDPTAIAHFGGQLTRACQDVWEESRLAKYATDIGKGAAVVSLALVGGLAAGLPGLGILTGAALSPLADPIKRAAGRASEVGLLKILGKSYLAAIYDFQSSLPPSAPGKK